MITIDQLLDSVDLDFEPRFVTKDKNETICLFANRPTTREFSWATRTIDEPMTYISHIKLSDFADKHWTECIYEVPRKVDYTKWVGKLCRLTNGKAKPRYAILDRVAVKPSIHPFEALGLRFSSCEPVRPDDDIIYKGE